MAGVENIDINSVGGNKEEQHPQHPVAYHPIPRFVIKEEPQSDEDQDERDEQMQHLMAYPPLPHGEIKEESEIGEDRDEFISNGEELMAQEEGNWDQSNQDSAAESGSAVRESNEGEGSEYDKGGERSEHSSLEDLEESDNSISVDSTDEEDFLPSPKAGPSKEPTRQVRKATHRKIREDGSNHTAPKKRFKCSKCERFYQLKSSLTFHLKNECGIEPRFRCTHCDRRFKRKDLLQKHLINVHKIDRKQLDNHVPGFKERREMPFKCPKCDSSYKHKRSLDQHMKKECGVAFNCTMCKKNYTKKNSLRRHLLIVHNITRNELEKYGAGFKIRPIHPYKCEQCGRTYTLKTNLVRHLTVECGVESSFPCPQCDYLFKRKSGLKLHLVEIHQVERSQLAAFGLGPKVRPEYQFRCDRCGSSYKYKHNLKRHLVDKCEK